MSTLAAKVKNVLSGDTLVLVPPKTAQFPVPERLLTLQYVRGESFEAKEYLRKLVLGKVVKFQVLFKVPALGKEFGDVLAPIFSSLIVHMLEKGLVKLKDNVRADSDEEEEFIETLKQAEASAQNSHVGVWAKGFSEPEIVPVTAKIIESSQKKPLPAIIEKVLGGDRVVARILVNKGHHVQQPVLLAGVKSPRSDDEDPKLAKIAQQAKQYVEDHLLSNGSGIQVKIVGENNTGVPIVLVIHPSGNSIHEKLLENGLAEIVDWQSTLVGSAVMGQLRKAELSAKALGKGLFASFAGVSTPSAASARTISAKSLRPGLRVENAVVSKVVSVDTYNVRLPAGDEVTVQLASLRGPKPNDTTLTSNSAQQQVLVQMAREFARNHAIGRTVTMHVDGFRQANDDLNLPARFLVSFEIGGKDFSEQIVSHGFATVIKHNKQTANERALNWDRLVEIEEEQKKAGKKGVFYQGDISKILTMGARVVNASESQTKAKTFFNGFQKKGRMAGFHVEYVSAGNRVKLFNAKEGTKLTLVLGGLANSRAEDSLDYLNRKYLQRNVEFEVYDTDKVGGFIGNLYANAQATKPVQVELLEQGLVSLFEHAAHSNKFGADLFKAEEQAKSGHKGIWKDYDASAAQAEADEESLRMKELSLESQKPKFFDIEVVDLDKSGVLSFHLTDANTSRDFAKFKEDFNSFHGQNASASAASTDLPVNLTKAPKRNEFVAAKFAENGKYYRARVVGFDRSSNTYEVKHVDFGNVDKVPLSSLRILPKRFGTDVIRPFAHTCKLQNIQLPPTQPKDYLTEAIYLLEDLTFDKKLVLSGLPSRTQGIEYDAILYDAEESLKDPEYTINKQLVAEGYGIVEPVAGANLKEYVAGLLQVQKKAKSDRVGCWELGDITADEL